MALVDRPSLEPTLVVEPLMSIEEVAECLRISERGVYRLFEKGELTPVKIGASTRLEPEELRGFIARQRQGASNERGGPDA